MKHYVIDTNFIHLDFFLRGTNITVLTLSAKNLGYHVYMPQVVFDEMCDQYNEEVDKTITKQEKYKEAIDRVTPHKNKIVEIQDEQLKASYPSILMKRCGSLEITILDYPHINHRDVVQRELQNRKPFKSSSKGYRDTLIWETVLEFGGILEGDSHIVFLTKNTKDFAKENEPEQLHADLTDDCIKTGLAKEKISLISDFQGFIEKDLLPASEQMEERIKELLISFAVGNINIHDIIDTNLKQESLQHLFDYNPEIGQTPYAPGVYERVMLHFVSPYNMSIYDVRRISENDVLISVQVEFDIYMDCLIFKGDLALIDDKSMPTVFDRNWNEHYVAATDNARMKMQYDILTDADFKQLNNVDERVLSVDYLTGFRYRA